MAVGSGVMAGDALGVGDAVAVGVADSVGVGVGDSLGVGVGVSVADGVTVGVAVGVAVGVTVGVGVLVGVGVGVAVGVCDGVGVGVALGPTKTAVATGLQVLPLLTRARTTSLEPAGGTGRETGPLTVRAAWDTAPPEARGSAVNGRSEQASGCEVDSIV